MTFAPQLVAALGISPNGLLTRFGLIGLGLVVFAESGLLIGFFLPGDSLLFAAGLLTATGLLHAPIAAVIAIAVTAAAIGDQVGYRIGQRAGSRLFTRPRSRLFNPNHAATAKRFFARHGPRTIVVARFIPVVRTFTPIVAGVANMPQRAFTMFNLTGAALWGAGVPTAGWLLGRRYPALGDRIDLVALLIIAVSVLPMIVQRLRNHHESDTPA